MTGITNAVTVVTGAAQGNGKEIAKGFAAAGAKVILCDIQETELDKATEEIQKAGHTAVAQKLDVTDPANCALIAKVALDQFNAPVDILINNAGIIRRTSPEENTFDNDWSAIMNVNATGSMNMICALLPQLKETKGRIINLASVMSVSSGPGLVAYSASKGAVLQMTRALCHDLSQYGIRVNAIAPGVIETPMTAATRENPDAINRFMSHTPMRRVGQPNELVGPALFLASEASSYVTGALIPVDGGYLAA